MLVDTSVWIDYFNGHASQQADRLALAIADAEPIFIPGLVLTEILLGLKTDLEASKIADLLGAFDVVNEPNRSDYIEAAKIYRFCRSNGYTIRSTIDCLIVHSAYVIIGLYFVKTVILLISLNVFLCD